MIEQMFSVPEIQDKLTKMVQAINQELLHRSASRGVAESSSSEKVSVLVTCLRGTCISPCYVERLYRMYRYHPPVDGLTVKRVHPLLKDKQQQPPGEGKEFVWQRSVLATKYLDSRHDLTRHKMWSHFPMHVVTVIEEGFRRNPFNTSLDVRYSVRGGKYVLNFETGEVYSTHEQQTYRLRCIVSRFDDLFECQHLTGSTYKPFSRKYDAAGILFYSPHPVTGEPVFLLGHMTYGSESWCDFGGLKKLRYVCRFSLGPCIFCAINLVILCSNL